MPRQNQEKKNWTFPIQYFSFRISFLQTKKWLKRSQRRANYAETRANLEENLVFSIFGIAFLSLFF